MRDYLAGWRKSSILRPVFKQAPCGHHPVNNDIMLSVSITVTSLVSTNDAYNEFIYEIGLLPELLEHDLPEAE